MTPARRRATPILLAAQETPDLEPESLHLDEERIVPLDAIECSEVSRDASLIEGASDGTLLRDREQQVRLDANDERLLQLRAAQNLHMLAMFAQVEAIH